MREGNYYADFLAKYGDTHRMNDPSKVPEGLLPGLGFPLLAGCVTFVSFVRWLTF